MKALRSSLEPRQPGEEHGAGAPESPAMRVATWHINNVVKRGDLLCDWLERTQPDVVA